MALVSMRQLPDHAAENGYGVPAHEAEQCLRAWRAGATLEAGLGTQ